MLLVIFSLFLFISFSSSQSQLPPGLETVRQSVQNLSWRNGACRSGTYAGEVNLAGVPDGSGTYSCFSHTYTGDWREGVRHGRGVNTFSNGDVYTGEWDNDERHGHGELTWISGRSYAGGMVRGKMQGRGSEDWRG
eukprot:GFUD01057600.1.p2 GENE.GFUD01057600.1~~GFUD01057600.1.p2  ORF type:complete len:143 (+),score=36.79 GFUD01057600.1:24-431(+)